MTAEEAAAILGPELTAQILERPSKPLTEQQIALLVTLLGDITEPSPRSDAA